MLAAIILAAGSSTRFHHAEPKLFMRLGSKTLIEIILERFIKLRLFDQIILVTNKHKNFLPLQHKFKTDITFINGGIRRQDSVRNALNALDAARFDKVLIHDAARYNCSEELIKAIASALTTSQAVVPVIPIHDTVKIIDKTSETITATIDRSSFAMAQTPQGFDLKLIKQLHNEAAKTTSKTAITATDDAYLFECNNLPVTYILGEKGNHKITEMADYDLALKLSLVPEYIHAHGYDLHRFDDPIGSHHIKLGGIAIPHERRLIAHSDGDVLLHSLTDSVLGLASASDIGELFPDDKEENKNRNSLDFLMSALAIISLKGIEVTHIDVTMIMERPKLSPYKLAIRDNLASIFHIKNEQVNIKAKTNERIGEIGAGNAIAVLTTITGKRWSNSE